MHEIILDTYTIAPIKGTYLTNRERVRLLADLHTFDGKGKECKLKHLKQTKMEVKFILKLPSFEVQSFKQAFLQTNQFTKPKLKEAVGNVCFTPFVNLSLRCGPLPLRRRHWEEMGLTCPPLLRRPFL